MKFKSDDILDIAQSCDASTGDPILESLYSGYDVKGSPRLDVPAYYRFLFRLSRRFPGLTMIELGCRDGGASLHFLKGGGMRSIGIDLFPRHYPPLFSGSDFVPRIHSSMCYREADRALLELPAPPDIVFIDTDHTYDTTATEFELWRPRVRSGGMILFDDIDAPEYECGRFFRELEGNKLDLPFLHPKDWGFGVYFVP